MTYYATEAIGQAVWSLTENTNFLISILDVINNKAGEIVKAAEKQQRANDEITAAFGSEIAKIASPTSLNKDDLDVLNNRARFIQNVANFIEQLLKELRSAEWISELKVTPESNKLRVTMMTKRHGIYAMMFNCQGVYFSDKTQNIRCVGYGDPEMAILRFDVGSIRTLALNNEKFRTNFAYAFAMYVRDKFCKLNEQQNDEDHLEW